MSKFQNIYPEEVIGVVAPQSNKFENMLHSFRGNIWVKPEFDVSMVSLEGEYVTTATDKDSH